MDIWVCWVLRGRVQGSGKSDGLGTDGAIPPLRGSVGGSTSCARRMGLGFRV